MKIVLIRWADSHGSTESSWHSVRDYLRHHSQPSVMLSVGVLLADHADYIVVAGHMHLEEDPEDDDCGGVMTIPRHAIRSLETLCEVERE